MKHYEKLLILFFSLTIVLPCCGLYAQQQGIDRNPYHLDLIQTTEAYRKQIQQNPKMEMLDMKKAIPDLVLDIRYATANNFTGKIIYEAPKAFARKAVVAALRKVQDSLASYHYGLKIYDAYRPYAASLKFYEVYPDTNFVANPRYGSRHNRGCAIDLSLVVLKSGKDLPMPTAYDDFTEKANPTYAALPADVLANRKLLFGIMSHFGFTHFATEWWHFDYSGWENYKLMDLTFEELEKAHQ